MSKHCNNTSDSNALESQVDPEKDKLRVLWQLNQQRGSGSVQPASES